MARLVAVTVLTGALASAAWAGAPRPRVGEPVGHLVFASPQSNPVAVSADGSAVYVANTTSDTLGIYDASSLTKTRDVHVGMEPVSVAVRPGGHEVWVANHVSDSVSVVDVTPGSATFGHVVETVQDLDAQGATLFDEPVGIAFTEDGQKAYVALSSRNQIAVIDANTYQVTKFIQVRAQDPRAIMVRNGLLFAIPFESNNQTQLSACVSTDGTANCTLGLSDLITFASEPNLPNNVKNIIVDPNAPDRDLFVYDTNTDTEVAAISHLGTLLYGLTVDSTGRVYIAETDARNAVNGSDGDVLASLDDRMFDNQLVEIPCSSSGCGTATIVNLEPGGTTHANSLATPYGLALDEANGHVLMTAAGASRVASFNSNLSGGPISVLDVAATPRGIAFAPGPQGAPGTAYVLSTLANTLSQISVAPDGTLSLLNSTIVGNDPTPDAVRRGEIAFNNAFASTTGNFSCASCHPDGNTDQLLWRIGGSCTAIGCAPGDEPRSTMPIRGLENTLPLHWDGVFGDPFGGGNGSVGFNGNGGTDCTLGDANGDHDCFLDIVVGTLAGPMCQQPCSSPELTTQERDDMATFIANVVYPPARSRRMDDHVSRASDPVALGSLQVNALQGFSDFFMNKNGASTLPKSCADINAGCHTLPLGASTNSSTLDGFDAPTMRGMTDRFLQFSMGPTAAVPILEAANGGGFLGASPLEAPIQWDPNIGYEEITTFGTAFGIFQFVYGVRPLNLFQMFEEASTGFSGALGRQVTLNTATASQPATVTLMTELESADQKGVVNLRAIGERNGASVTLSYQPNGHYEGGTISLTPAQLRSEASQGTTLVTLTADLRQNLGTAPQPLLATAGPPSGNGTGPIDNPPLPDLTTGGGAASFTVTGTDVNASAVVFLDGDVASGATVSCTPDATGYCPDGTIQVDLTSTPAAGPHLLQVQNPSGWLSNEMPICVGAASGCMTN